MTGVDLLFYPETHEYFTPPGRDGGLAVPNVTTILSAVRASVDFDALERVRPGVVEFRRQLGTAVHHDCHAYDDEDLDVATVDARVRPYLDVWGLVRMNKRLRPVTRERRVYHDKLGFCGTLDGIFEIVDTGQRILADLKIGDPEDAAAHLQTAGYEAAYRHEFPDERIDERWSIQLCPGLATPYRIQRYRDFRDFGKFQACLTVFHEQPARRRKIR